MHVKGFLVACALLLPVLPARAQYREFEYGHERFREHVSRPAYVMPAPRYDEHGRPHPVVSGKSVREIDGPACDRADADPDAAIEACGRIIDRGLTKKGYGVAVAYAHRAQAYESKGDHDNAIADFSEAIRLKPTVSDYFAMRAAVEEKAGNLVAARSDFRVAAKLDPKNVDATNALRRIEARSMITAPDPATAATVATTVTTTKAAPPVAAVLPPRRSPGPRRSLPWARSLPRPRLGRSPRPVRSPGQGRRSTRPPPPVRSR